MARPRVELRRAFVLACTSALCTACSPTLTTPERIPDTFVERYAAARCGAVSRCACDPAGWVDDAMCTAAMRQTLDERIAALREDDVAYDGACFESLVAFWDSADACDPNADAPYCAMVVGDGDLGDACTSVATHGFSASSCDTALFCGAEGECTMSPSSISVELGESCVAALSSCIEGSHCDPTAGVCAADLGAGSPCALPQACDEASWCAGLEGDTPGTCLPRAGEGEACESTSAWDARACARVDGATRYCVEQTCTFAVAAACGPWL